MGRELKPLPLPTLNQCPGFDCNTDNMATAVEQGMIGLIELFRSYASKGGDPKKLSKKELKDLIKTEFPTFVSECKDLAKLDDFMSELDLNGDGQMDFNEFMVMLSTVTMMCNEMLEGMEGN